MSRRRQLEEHENHDRWLVSYADFITLLFAFFVVMYSISSLNEGKYRVLSDTLGGVFNQPDRSIKPIPIGDERPRTTEPERAQFDQEKTPDTDAEQTTEPLNKLADSIREAFGDLIQDNKMTVRGNELWVEIELNSGLLFNSGDAVPNELAFDIVDKIAKILAPYENPVHVEGFTDNIPISTPLYPSNWELSASRAASIVRMLAMDGINPSRMASVGYGEFQPVADNATEEGRGRNRRVVLVVSRNLDVRRSVAGVGSGKAQADSALQRAGTQSAEAPIAAPPASGAANSPSP